MYRLVLYYLMILLGTAEILSFFHVLPFDSISLLISTIFLVGICWMSNKIFAVLFHVPTNGESVYISALILALIITPSSIALLFFSGLFAIASKYVINLTNKHIFNPVAIGVFLAGILTGHYASWWVGTASLLPVITIGGYLVVRKIRRENMVFSFIGVVLLLIVGIAIFNKADLLLSLKKIFLETPLLFFASIMLTEPLTTPPTEWLQNIYGGIIGLLYTPYVHIAGFSPTPETALLVGNIFSYFVSPKIRARLVLQRKIKITKDIYNFVFSAKQKISFLPGQYMEWTLSHKGTDSRGNRRYFTIASSPSEKNITLGVRFYPHGSSFKNRLFYLSEKDEIIAAQIGGDFTMPKDTTKKLIFVAGGIGITPFRSMIKFLLDKKEKRDIVLFYTAKTIDDFAYKNIFDEAEKVLGLKVVYTVTDKQNMTNLWKGYTGRITKELIEKEISDVKERICYLSGSTVMINSFEQILKQIGVRHIKKDYFSGLA